MLNSDVSVMRTDQIMTLDGINAAPAPYACRSYYKGTIITYGGCGIYDVATGDAPAVAQIGTGVIISYVRCSIYDPFVLGRPTVVICFISQNSAACAGDSGGFVVTITSDGTYVLIAIVSFGASGGALEVLPINTPFNPPPCEPNTIVGCTKLGNTLIGGWVYNTTGVPCSNAI